MCEGHQLRGIERPLLSNGFECASAFKDPMVDEITQSEALVQILDAVFQPWQPLGRAGLDQNRSQNLGYLLQTEFLRWHIGRQAFRKILNEKEIDLVPVRLALGFFAKVPREQSMQGLSGQVNLGQKRPYVMHFDLRVCCLEPPFHMQEHAGVRLWD